MDTVPAGQDVPLIDLTGALKGDHDERGRVAREIDAACREVGFFSVVGHGVDWELVKELKSAGFAFFDLPMDEKMECEAAWETDYTGYVASEALSYSRGDASAPDLKESFTFYPMGRTPGKRQPWPRNVPALEAALTPYFAALERLAADLIGLFEISLGLEEGYFTPFIDRSLSALRVLHYPPLANPAAPNQFRAGAHTDFGSLTLLLTDDALGGLQVLTRRGEWVDVAYTPGAFVVNLGDLMEQWTNDRWVSTMHRVKVPPVGPGTRRLSAAFFHQPNEEAVITALPTCVDEAHPAKYAPMTSGEHMHRKVRLQREMQA